MAEIYTAEKDRISHRARAIRAMVPFLSVLAQGGVWETDAAV
jgi:inosine/xanthosine triphosphate pyrophosphatase family protein